MNRCRRCGMPDTRPGSIFTDGVCQACLNWDTLGQVDWAKRAQLLEEACCSWRNHAKPFDVVAPVSGGKDSHTIVKTLVDRGLHPLLVTVADPFEHTKAGTENLKNLSARFNLPHIVWSMSPYLFRRATRWAFEETGEALKFIEYAIYTIPCQIAKLHDVPVMFGENSAYLYGTAKSECGWDAEFHLGLMAAKIMKESDWWQSGGVKWREIHSIIPPVEVDIHYLSYYQKWSSETNRTVARSIGFIDLLDTGEWDRQGTAEQYEQIDSVGYMTHLWLKYPKFGFQRVSDTVSRRIREGTVNYDLGMEIIAQNDYKLDGRSMRDFCRVCGYTEDEFWAIAKKHDRGFLRDRKEHLAG